MTGREPSSPVRRRDHNACMLILGAGPEVCIFRPVGAGGESAMSVGLPGVAEIAGELGIVRVARVARIRIARCVGAGVRADSSDRGDDFPGGMIRWPGMSRPAGPSRKTTIAVGDFENVGQVVTDQDHRQAAFSQSFDQIEDLTGLRHTERGGGLVQDDDFRVPHHGPRNRHRLPLAAGQRCHRGDAPTAIGRRARRGQKRPFFSIFSSSSGLMAPPASEPSHSRPRKRLPTTSRLSHRARSW